MVPFVESRLPHDPILLQLLKAAQQTSDTETIIFDALGFEKSYPELLADILQTRDVLRMRLPSAVSEQGIFREPAQNVAIFSKSGYEFLVAFFTIRSMGGACMPLSRLFLEGDLMNANQLKAPASSQKKQSILSQWAKCAVCFLARIISMQLKLSAPISKSVGT